MSYEQLTLFPLENDKEKLTKIEKNREIKSAPSIESEKILDSFETYTIPFLGCNFDKVYPILANIMPEESIKFDTLGREKGIICEIVSSSICHQMNWDFLRREILKKSIEDIDWILPTKLKSIKESEVDKMFASYPKRERVRVKERTEMLHLVGEWLLSFKSVDCIFVDEDGKLLSKDIVRNNILKCPVFSNDPEEKKMQILLQKLSCRNYFEGISKYYEPAIDYHLLREYIRRGLLRAKNGFAKDYIKNMHIERKESTTSAIRSLCAEIMIDICLFTGLDICTMNQIEWHIGRSVCLTDNPDCFLEQEDSKWLKGKFTKCPFFDTCAARNYNPQLLNINEPIYKGTSY